MQQFAAGEWIGDGIAGRRIVTGMSGEIVRLRILGANAVPGGAEGGNWTFGGGGWSTVLGMAFPNAGIDGADFLVDAGAPGLNDLGQIYAYEAHAQ